MKKESMNSFSPSSEGSGDASDPILSNFLSLTAIPRKSHHEEAVSLFLYGWAVSKGLRAVRDEAGNVIIDKPAFPGSENAPRTILQAHMDMVCVAEPGRAYDPLTDPIRVVNNGTTLTADGTSLGGDDGAGVAVAMSILEDPEAVHGPLRAVFTVDEEDGMLGADKLDASHLDAQYLINLDWEAFGSLCCSSAGSDIYAFRRKVEREDAGESFALKLTLSCLSGGHSGAQIHLGRKNAIWLLARIISSLRGAGIPLRLAAFQGGSAHNAIPSEASATILVPADRASRLYTDRLEAIYQELSESVRDTDPDVRFDVAEIENVSRALTVDDSASCLEFLQRIPNGVNTWSKSIPGLVESSSNTGLAGLKADVFEIVVHQRSSDPAISDTMRRTIRDDAAKTGFAMEVLSSGPAWPVNPDSELVKLCKEEYKTLFHKDIRVEPVHAGLECGAWAMKNPALDIISIGPEITDVHSPKETMVISSMADCDRLVRALLRRIAER